MGAERGRLGQELERVSKASRTRTVHAFTFLPPLTLPDTGMRNRLVNKLFTRTRFFTSSDREDSADAPFAARKKRLATVKFLFSVSACIRMIVA